MARGKLTKPRSDKGTGLCEVISVTDLEAMATAGMSLADVARYYGCTRQALIKIMKNNPTIGQAFHNGMNHVLVKCVNVLLSKVEKGDTFATVYILNNRFKWMEEKHKKEKPKENTIPKVNIYLPENNRD